VGYILAPYTKSRKRKAVQTPKFYFFDTGVVNSLLGRESISEKTPAYGDLLEHLVFLELRAYLDYRRIRMPLSFWRSQLKHEVDFLIGDDIAIEVKAKARIGPTQLKGLRAFKEEAIASTYIVVSGEDQPYVTDDGIHVMPIAYFLSQLWDDKILNV